MYVHVVCSMYVNMRVFFVSVSLHMPYPVMPNYMGCQLGVSWCQLGVNCVSVGGSDVFQLQ